MGSLTMVRGDTRTVTETVGPTGLDSNGISGWSFWFTAKYDPNDADANAVFQKVPADWALQVAGDATTAGVILCTINPNDTLSLPAYRVVLFYDVQAKDTSGHIFTIDSGDLTVVADVTISTT